MRNSAFTFLILFMLAISGGFNAVAIACNSSSGTTDSGIEGQVFIGPTCPPVMRQEADCSARPYKATIIVLDRKGQIVTRITSDAEGRFQIALRPGRYTLRPESPRLLPYAEEQTVTVSNQKYTQVRIDYDSGIR